MWRSTSQASSSSTWPSSISRPQRLSRSRIRRCSRIWPRRSHTSIFSSSNFNSCRRVLVGKGLILTKCKNCPSHPVLSSNCWERQKKPTISTIASSLKTACHPKPAASRPSLKKRRSQWVGCRAWWCSQRRPLAHTELRTRPRVQLLGSILRSRMELEATRWCKASAIATRCPRSPTNDWLNSLNLNE